MVPNLFFLPIENSTIKRGIDQRNKNKSQGIKNDPPYCPDNRGNRQMFPAPIAMPMAAAIKPNREENDSIFLGIDYLVKYQSNPEIDTTKQ